MTDQIYGCLLKMVKTMEQSNNMRVLYITKCSKISAKSIIGFNIRIICRRLKLDKISQLMNMGSCILKKTYIQDHRALSVIQELRSCMKLMLLLNIYVPCKKTVKILYLYVLV